MTPQLPPDAALWVGVISVLVGGMVAVLAAGAVIWLRQRRQSRTALPHRRDAPWQVFQPLLRLLGPLARRSLTSEARRTIDAELLTSGSPDNLTAIDVRSAQWLAALSGGLGFLTLYGLPGSIADGCVLPSVMLLGWWWPRLWLREHVRKRQREVLRALPFTLDMMTLCLEGGLHFQQAVQQVVRRGPEGPLRDELERWLLDVRAGQTRTEALRNLAGRLSIGAVRQWVQVLVQADSLGMSLGPVLRAQADQRRTERFLRAEKLALQAPVKMLMPLILCIFPCTFLVIAFPVAMRMLDYFA